MEYGLLIGAAALVVIVAALFLADSLDSIFRKTGDETDVFRPPVAVCEQGYDGVCIPPAPPVLTCADLAGLGIPLPVSVSGGDPHGLDPDHDGLGCTSS